MMGRAAVFHGPGRPLELVSVATPSLQEGELLVRVSACSLCRSDLHSYLGRRVVETPAILGHEVIGKIEAVGPSTTLRDMSGQPAAIGDRITWSIIVGCGECFFCTHDLPQKCQRLQKYGHEPMHAEQSCMGGLADFVVLRPRTSWLRVSDQIPDSVAALANCAAATAAAVVRYAGPLGDQRVVIMGAGVLGALACAMARAAGARQIIIVDPHPQSRERAASFGASLALDAADAALPSTVVEATDGIGADVVLELAGARESVQAGLLLLRIGGTMVLAGSVAPCEPVALDPEQVVRRMITLRGVHNYHPRDLVSAVEFLADQSDRFPFESLVTERYPLEQVDDAFRRAQAAPGVRVIVVPH